MAEVRLEFTSTHERLSAAEAVKGSSDRSFGLVFAVVFCVIGLWPLLSGGGPRWWALAAALLTAGVAAARPALLAPFNRLWTRFGLLLNKIASPVIMGLLFFAMVTPFGLVMRWLGKDLLSLRFDAAAPSYWVARVPPGPAPETIKHQF